MRNGAVVDRTYRADEKVDQAIIEKREMQFLYMDGDEYVFMDTESYEQLLVPRPPSATRRAISSSRRLRSCDVDGEIIGVDIPASVELEVTQTEPGLQGDRVSGAASPRRCRRGSPCRYRCS